MPLNKETNRNQIIETILLRADYYYIGIHETI